MNTLVFPTPFAVFLGDVEDPGFAKTGFGLVEWRSEHCVGQVRLPGCPIDLGVPDLDPKRLSTHVRSLVIGVAARGGDVPQAWIGALAAAAASGVTIVSGGHRRLTAIPEIVEAARQGGAALVDVRVPPADLPIATGRRRTGKRLLTVGTDCAVGKKYSALALERAARRRGVNADFRATGQTGIMIAGAGVPIDAVVCDFTAGAAEVLSPDNAADHWDIIEGQGSLFHPSFAGVSLSLLHGSQPDAIVLCHDASRERILGLGAFPVPSLTEAIALNLQLAQLTNPDVRCVGVCVNTSGLASEVREARLAAYAEETGLPCVDPLVEGVEPILDQLVERAGR